MSKYRFSLVLSTDSPEYKTLSEGDVVRLQPELNNPADKHAIAAFVGDEKVGYVANSQETVAYGTRSASQIYKLIHNPKVNASCGLLLKESDFLNKAEENQRRFICEAFFVPLREEKQETKVVAEYPVGGANAKNTYKQKVIGMIVMNADDGSNAPVPVEIRRFELGGVEEYKVFLPGMKDSGQSAGVIKEEKVDDALKSLFTASDTIQAVATRVIEGTKSRDYYVSVTGESRSIQSFYPDIDQTILRAVDQVDVLEEKVSVMANAGFSDKAIQKVLEQMPALIERKADVPRPKQIYRQSNGNNLADLVSYMLFGKMVRLVGEKGSGKNTLVETACWLLNRPLCRVQGCSELDKLDILGSKTLTDGCTSFELSNLLTTLRDDGIVVVDEANTIRPDVLTLLHSLTDGARAIDVPGYGPVKMGEHACILYTLNENYVGTGEMNAATIDRGPSMFIEQEQDMTGLLKAAVPDCDPKDLELCVKIAAEIRKSVRESGSLSKDAETIRGYIDALETSSFIPLKRALIQNVANKAQSESERNAIEMIIISFCG